LLIVTALLVAGVGGGRNAFAAPPASACSMLTPGQIQDVLGQPFGAPKEVKLIPPFGDKWGSHCTYRSQKGPEIAVDFFVHVVGSAAEARQWFDMGASTTKPRSKPAIGDSAYISLNDAAIYVLKGKVYYWISINPANEKGEKALAAAVAARI
jgi:hypothetical protein